MFIWQQIQRLNHPAGYTECFWRRMPHSHSPITALPRCALAIASVYIVWLAAALTSFLWMPLACAQVITHDAHLADALGFQDAECVDMASGRRTILHREAVGEHWMLVRVLSHSALCAHS